MPNATEKKTCKFISRWRSSRNGEGKKGQVRWAAIVAGPWRKGLGGIDMASSRGRRTGGDTGILLHPGLVKLSNGRSLGIWTRVDLLDPVDGGEKGQENSGVAANGNCTGLQKENAL